MDKLKRKRSQTIRNMETEGLSMAKLRPTFGWKKIEVESSVGNNCNYKLE